MGLVVMLVLAGVFKTLGRRVPSLVGSIPTQSRQTRKIPDQIIIDRVSILFDGSITQLVDVFRLWKNAGGLSSISGFAKFLTTSLPRKRHKAAAPINNMTY